MYDDSTGLQKICLERAVKRLNNKIENVQTIYSNEIAIMVFFSFSFHFINP